MTGPRTCSPESSKIADFARREGLLAVIDNTFASPVNFRPLAAGFDLCVHSATDPIRVSCGIEGQQDLIADFAQALAKI